MMRMGCCVEKLREYWHEIYKRMLITPKNITFFVIFNENI